jgi:hypothetical protein
MIICRRKDSGADQKGAYCSNWMRIQNGIGTNGILFAYEQYGLNRI